MEVNMRKRDYNKKTYKAFAKTTKKIRNHCSDDPLEEIKMTGLTGEVLGGIIDKPIDTITHKASKALTSLSYDKENDKPYKGSAIYTGWWLILKKVFKRRKNLLQNAKTCGIIMLKKYGYKDFNYET
jgi:hypothetical protein